MNFDLFYKKRSLIYRKKLEKNWDSISPGFTWWSFLRFSKLQKDKKLLQIKKNILKILKINLKKRTEQCDMIPFAWQNAYMSLEIEGGGSSTHQNPKKWGFTCSITHPTSTRMFGQEHASFLDKNVHSSSSVLYSYTRKIIGNSEWWKMAGPLDQLTLEARHTVFHRCWKPVELYP